MISIQLWLPLGAGPCGSPGWIGALSLMNAFNDPSQCAPRRVILGCWNCRTPPKYSGVNFASSSRKTVAQVQAKVGRCDPRKVRPEDPLRYTSSHAASIRRSSSALESPPALASVEAKSFESRYSMLTSSSTIKSRSSDFSPSSSDEELSDSPKKLLLNSGVSITSIIIAVIRTLDALA